MWLMNLCPHTVYLAKWPNLTKLDHNWKQWFINIWIKTTLNGGSPENWDLRLRWELDKDCSSWPVCQILLLLGHTELSTSLPVHTLCHLQDIIDNVWTLEVFRILFWKFIGILKININIHKILDGNHDHTRNRNMEYTRNRSMINITHIPLLVFRPSMSNSTKMTCIQKDWIQ